MPMIDLYNNPSYFTRIITLKRIDAERRNQRKKERFHGPTGL